MHLFSHAVGREGHYRQISPACVGSAHSVLATLGLPPLTACVLSPSTLLRLQVALQAVVPELHALPSPKPLRFRFLGTAQRPRLNWACVLCLPIRAAQGTRRLKSALSLGALHLIPSAVPDSVSGCASCVHLASLLGS